MVMKLAVVQFVLKRIQFQVLIGKSRGFLDINDVY